MAPRALAYIADYTKPLPPMTEADVAGCGELTLEEREFILNYRLFWKHFMAEFDSLLGELDDPTSVLEQLDPVRFAESYRVGENG